MRDLDASRTTRSRTPVLDPARSEILYVIHQDFALERGTLVVDLLRRDRKKDGTWGNEKALSIAFGDAERLPDEADRRIFGLLRGSESRGRGFLTPRSHETVGNPPVLSKETIPFAIPALAASGRGV